LKKKGPHASKATCKARIRGGWDRGGGDTGHFGVKLDLPNDYIESYEASSSQIEIDRNEFGSTIFTFYVNEPNRSELHGCKLTDSVNLWKPSDGKERLYIFRRGSAGAGGRIGFVPDACFERIASHLDEGLPVETRMIEVSSNTCKIKCTLISKVEREKQTRIIGEHLRSELIKKYTPKKGFLLELQLPKTHNLRVGQSLYLAAKPIEYYVQNPSPLRIKFVDQQKRVVAEKTNEPNLIRRILKAYFNDYELDFKISAITEPSKDSLRYLDTIEAYARLAFRK
jgi:hypothetical protein